MRVGYDARLLTHGVGTYTRSLLRALLGADDRHEYVVFVADAEGAEALGPLPERARTVVVGAAPFTLREQPTLLRALARNPVDLFHATSYPSPWRCRAPLVVTIHDLLCKADPAFYPRIRGPKGVAMRLYYEWMNHHATHAASHILTVSDYAREEILRFYPDLDPARITVAYNGVDPAFTPRPEEEVRGMRAHYGLDAPYLLFVGTFNPRKNLLGCLEAMARLVRSPQWRHDLAVAARIDPRYPEIQARIRDLGLAERVHLLDYVPAADLPALFSGAAAVVQPAFHESFGLPVVEAFACGVPVVTASTTALPEVGGDAALYVDPADVGALAAAMERVVGDRALRGRLIERGRARAALFSWDRTAARTLQVYAQVAGDG